MISVFRTSQHEIDAFLTSRIKRCPTRSGGLICYAQIEPMSAGRYSFSEEVRATKHNHGRKRFRRVDRRDRYRSC